MRILITGGTGSLGSRLVEHWYGQHQITVLSKDPHKRAALEARFPDVAFVLADLCDFNQVKHACTGQDVLIHAAAIKQIGVGFYEPIELARVNVTGTTTVAQAWEQTHTVNKGFGTIFISSDKACAALNAYGASKKMGETIFRRKDFSVLRYGNVVESKGAFIEAWKKQIEQGQPIVVREPDPTRFFLTFEDAIALVEDVLEIVKPTVSSFGHNGIFIPRKIKAFSIGELAQHFTKNIVYERLLQYEKRHEWLLAEGETAVPVSELLYEIRPSDWKEDVPNYFCSASADMMSPSEVLGRLNYAIE